MKKYNVVLIETTEFEFVVEAENEEQAEERAYELYTSPNGREYAWDCDAKIEDIYEVYEDD